MNDDEKRIVIAKKCGWRVDSDLGTPFCIPPKGNLRFQLTALPDYLNDLNAILEAEKTLDPHATNEAFWYYLYHVTKGDLEGRIWLNCDYNISKWMLRRMVRATARQHADAFILAYL